LPQYEQARRRLRFHRRDGRANNFDLFIAKQAVLACMRVHPGHGNARVAVAYALQEGIGNANHGFYPILVQRIKEFAQRDVGSDVNDLKPIGIKHHGVIFAVGQMRQQFGMTRIVVSRQMQRFFIQRCGCNGFNLTRHRQLCRSTHAAVGQIASLSLYHTSL
jgi:hypothetical protein